MVFCRKDDLIQNLGVSAHKIIFLNPGKGSGYLIFSTDSICGFHVRSLRDREKMGGLSSFPQISSMAIHVRSLRDREEEPNCNSFPRISSVAIHVRSLRDRED